MLALIASWLSTYMYSPFCSKEALACPVCIALSHFVSVLMCAIKCRQEEGVMGRILVEENKQVRCMRHFRSLQAA